MATDQFEKAKNYAFLLLKYRPRSEREMIARLKRKNFEEKTIFKAISFLKEKKFLDDNYFTSAWINSRLKKPYGFRRIKQELTFKGIDQETIDKQAESCAAGYREEEVVKELAEKAFIKVKSVEPAKARARVYAYLMRRGFSPETIISVINSFPRSKKGWKLQ